MKALLSTADSYGVRRSYDRTIEVRAAREGHIIYDELTKTTHARQSLGAARQLVGQILDVRPHLDWPAAWSAHGLQTLSPSWQIRSGRTTIWIERIYERGQTAAEGWISGEVTVERPGTFARHYSWRLEGFHPLAVAKAHFIAHAEHLTFQEESP